jgi:hypothetical protein
MVYCWLGYGWYATPGTSLAVHAAGFRKSEKDLIRVLTAGLPQVHYAVLGAVEPCLLFDK